MTGYREDRRRVITSLCVFYALSNLFIWTTLFPRLGFLDEVAASRLSPVLGLIGAYGPTFAVALTALIFGRPTSLFPILRSLVRWDVGIRWYLFAVFWSPVLLLTALGLHLLLGGTLPSSLELPMERYVAGTTGVSTVVSIPVFFFVQCLILVGEEMGWRGYALPGLLSIAGWRVSGLVLGLAWGLWHIPLFLSEGTPQADIPFLWYMADILASSVVFAWAYVRSRRSLLIAVILHAAINTSMMLVPVLPNIAGSVRPFLLALLLKWITVVAISRLNSARSDGRQQGQLEGGN